MKTIRLSFSLFLFVVTISLLTARTASAAAPKFVVTAVKIIDGSFNVIKPTAGQAFYVEVAYNYVNPTCTPYNISRVVNGWTNIEGPLTNGCGYTGTTAWAFATGPWLMYKGGTYPITVTVDSGNAVTASTQTQKTLTTNVVVSGGLLPQWAVVDAEIGRTNLSPGTDVIVGTMDDAFDFNDPLYTGNDSKGRPRLIGAFENTLGVNGGPTNDVHSTACLGIVVARGTNNGEITGLAPDARFVCAEFLNRANVPAISEPNILDAANICLTNHADVLNMPWSEWSGSTTDSETGEAPISDLMADYFAYASNVFCVAYDNELKNPIIPTAPGAARNVITVGGLDTDLIHTWIGDNYGPTLDGRCKPDIIGGQATNCVTPYWGWRAGYPAIYGYEGNSFAGPFVTGAAAQMIGYAKKNGLNRDHRLLKAMIMNSGVPTLNDLGQTWTNSPTVPLDQQQGTGIMKMSRVFGMYSAGQQTPGAVAVPGFDFHTVYGSTTHGNNTLDTTNGLVTYQLGSPVANADLDVTLAWDRHTFWSDLNGNGIIDAADTFYTSPSTDAQSILNLVLYRNGVAVAQSISSIDTIQHLHLTNLTTGAYQLNVERLNVPNSTASEPYGLAWYSTVRWTNLQPAIVLQGVALSSGNTVVIQTQLSKGQVESLQLQSTPTLAPPVTWTPVANATLTQTASNTFQFLVPVQSGPRFFRLVATP